MSKGLAAADRSLRMRTSWMLMALLVVVAAGIMFSVASVLWRGKSTGQPMPQLVTSKEYQLAREAFELKYGRRADRLDILSWLAEWYLAKQRPADAVVCFAEIPTAHSQYGRMARYQQGRTLLNLHRAVEAESQLRELIALEESSSSIEHRYLVDARHCLRHIFEVELRFEERHRLLQGVLDRQEEDVFEAVAGCFPSLLRWNGADTIHWLEQFRTAGPRSLWLEVAFGRYRTSHGRFADALPALQDIVREHPHDLWANAVLIDALRQSDDLDSAQALLDSLPPQSKQDPWLLLLLRGAFALEMDRPAVAVTAYEQVLEQDRTSTEAWQGLLRATRLVNDVARQSTALAMVNALGRIQNHLGKTIQDSTNPHSFLDVADLCLDISLQREAKVMFRCARRISPDDDRVRATASQFQEQ